MLCVDCIKNELGACTRATTECPYENMEEPDNYDDSIDEE